MGDVSKAIGYWITRGKRYCQWVLCVWRAAYCHLPEGHDGDHDYYRCIGDLPNCGRCPQEHDDD